MTALFGRQILQTYGGVLHIQNSTDLQSNNTGYDIANRPNGTYKLYDGNGVELPFYFENNTLVLKVDTLVGEGTNPVGLENFFIPQDLPKRDQVIFTTSSAIAPNSTSTETINLKYSSVSLQKILADTDCCVRLYPSLALAALDARVTTVSLVQLPPSNCALINQISVLANVPIVVSAQSIGMTTANNISTFAISVTNNDNVSRPIQITLDYLALEKTALSAPI